MAANENPQTASSPATPPAADSANLPAEAQAAAAAQTEASVAAAVTDSTAAVAPPVAAQDSAPKPPSKVKKFLIGLKENEFWGHLRGIARDLVSYDEATRKMARYFFAAVIGVITVLVLSIISIRQIHFKSLIGDGTTEQGKNFGEFVAKQAEEAKIKFSSQSLGTFSIELKTPDGGENARRSQKVMNLAEVEIVVTCDEKETCDFIEDNLPQARNQLTNIFVAMDRDEMLSKEGKRRLKAKALQKLNLWLPQGKIENLFFDKLIIN